MARSPHALSLSPRNATTGRQTWRRDADDFVTRMLESTAHCALIDGKGFILGASAALQATVPGVGGQALGETFQTDISILLKHQAGDGPTCYGSYTGPTGELTPVILKPLVNEFGTDGSILVLVIDGAPFRQAESERLSAAPYTAIRVGPDGQVRFANHAAADIFCEANSDTLVGRPLVSLFATEDRTRIEAALLESLTGHAVAPLEVTIAKPGTSALEILGLLLMPDPAPGGLTLGSVAVVRSLTVERAREAIRRIALDPSIPDWRERLRAVLKKVQPVVPFDRATFGIYADDARLYRAMLIEPEASFSWPSRWMELPSSIKTWLQEGKTWVSDISSFVSTEPKLRDNEVTRLNIEQGFLSSVTLPAMGADGPTSALSLASTSHGRVYTERDLVRLRRLDLEPVLLRIEFDIKATRDRLCQELARQVTGTEQLRDAGPNIINKIATHFDWDHVSLFRVSRHKERFDLVYQSARNPDYQLPLNYVQPLGAGMLKATISNDKTLIVDDTRSRKLERHGYIPVNQHFRSAMTVPVHLNGRIRWIINAEACVTHAFRGPDKYAIEEVIAAIERGLDQRMIAEIKSNLLHETQQGVLVVGLEGTILEMNSVASRLLGAPRATLALSAEDATKRLVEYAANDFSSQILQGLLPTTGQRIELKGSDDKVRAVLATKRDLEESFDTAIWFLTDLNSRDWSRELRFLRETASDVAQQTRGPLMLALTLAQRALALWRIGEGRATARSVPSGIAADLARLVAEISKADIPFERLAEGLSIVKEPLRVRELVALQDCVAETVALLPERDRQRVIVEQPRDPVVVSGDAGRIGFVVRSILAHLLRCRPDDNSQVEVGMAYDDSQRAQLNLQLTHSGPTSEVVGGQPGDVIWAALQSAREDSGLGLGAIEKIIRAHGGKLSKKAALRDTPDPSPPWVAFKVMFPSPKSNEHPS